MANKNLTDLTARTATDDADLLHVSSGGTDYKEEKGNFLADVPQKATFEVTSTLFSQIDALPRTSKKYYGIIGSYGYQAATGVPINANFYVDAYINSSNSAFVRITVVGTTGRSFWASKGNGTWGSWYEDPSRSEIETINGTFAKGIKTINAGTSQAFTLESNSRILLDVFGGASARNGMYNIFVSSMGGVVVTPILAGTNVSISTGTNTVTITNTMSGTGNALYINAIIFAGSIGLPA